MAEWGGAAESDLMAAGAEALPDGRSGVRLRGWHIESSRRPILGSLALQEWEEKLGTSHLPEMVFGESSLYLLHEDSGIKLHFNAFDALKGWKQESLPPVEVPAAATWKSRSKPFQQVILDYDYTFTTPYCGSEAIEPNTEKLRIDGVLMRLRDTRVYCPFVSDHKSMPAILRESCWREATIQSLSAEGFPSDSAAYRDPNLIGQRLPVITHKTQRLKVSRSITGG